MFILETTSLRPRKFIIAIPLIMLAAVLVPLLFITPDLKNIKGVQFFFLIPIIFTVLFWLALRKIKIDIDNNGLTYRSLFSTKAVLWNEVVKAYIRYQQHG